MRTVLIFDYGFSGYLLGNKIEDTLMVAVKRLTAGSEQDLVIKTNCEILQEAEKLLLPYIGHVNAIVLANPIVSMLAKEYLEKRFPRQIFVGYGWDLPALLDNTRKALVLTSDKISRSESYQKMKAQCGQTEISESDCQRWLDLIREDVVLEDSELAPELEQIRGGKVIIYNSRLLMMKKRLAEKLGWKVEVTDFFDLIVDRLCHALDLDFEIEP
ncbi:hypothetical protein IJG79_02465 [Candidatus Saccharibacteria bacterium]|nr:hypothetical protein [Candidatus Saccharibacteria bacterium]